MENCNVETYDGGRQRLEQTKLRGISIHHQSKLQILKRVQPILKGFNKSLSLIYFGFEVFEVFRGF